MAGKKKKDTFHGDTFNSLEKIDKEFHWCKEYSWYLDLPVEDTSSKHLRYIGLVKVECMLEVFGVPELVLWCPKCFDATKRIICVGDSSVLPISLIPIVFQKRMKFPNPNKELKLLEADDSISNHGGPKILLTDFKYSLFGVKTNAYQFDTDFLKDQFKEFAWLFARVTGQESTTYYPWYVMFVLCDTFRMNWSFD